MSHAAALTDMAVGLLDGPHQAKRLSGMIACSYRTVQDWRAHRRRMCLDHAVELAAKNEAFAAALLARIEQAREQNAIDRRDVAAAAGGSAAGAGRAQEKARAAGGELGAAVVGVAAGVAPLSGRTRGRA